MPAIKLPRKTKRRLVRAKFVFLAELKRLLRRSIHRVERYEKAHPRKG